MLISAARLLGFLDASVPNERTLRATLARLHVACGSGGDEARLTERLARILGRRGHKASLPANGASKDRYVIAGAVAIAEPAGVKVDIFAATFASKEPSEILASTTTTEHGEYFVTFDASVRPVFRVRFLADTGVLHVSPPKLAVGDDWVEWSDSDKAIPRPGAFDVGRALLDSTLAEHGGKTLEELDDSPEASEVLLLAEELGIAEEIVVRHVASARLAQKLGVPDAAAFALLGRVRGSRTRPRKVGAISPGIDSLVEDAHVRTLRRPPSAVIEEISRAIDRREVSGALGDVLPKVRDSLQDKHVQHRLEQPLAGGSRWREVLSAAGVPDADLVKVATALLSGPEQTAWASVAEKLGDGNRAQAIRDALSIGALVDHDARVLGSLLRDGHTTPRAIARLSATQIDATLAQVGLGSKERAERVQKIHERADIQFPGDSLLRRRASRLSPDTNTFLNASVDRFDLMTAHLAGLAQTGALSREGSKSEKIRKELAPLQRIARVSPNAQVADILLDHKYESAQRIAFTSRAGFKAQMKSAGLAEDVALATHRSAKLRYRATVENYLRFNRRANGPRVAAIPSAGNPVARASVPATPNLKPAVTAPAPSAPTVPSSDRFDVRANVPRVAATPSAGNPVARASVPVTPNLKPAVTPPAPSAPTVPSYDLLFGSQDYCACGQCSSVTGPAAYLVDLLLWLQNILPGSPSSSPSPFNLVTGQATISTVVVSGATTTITTSTPHGFQNGDSVAIANVHVVPSGNAAPNATWTIANVTAATFTIPFSGPGAYSGGTARNRSRTLGRRPDLTQLLLNCANTETLIPQIDIVCELLEDHIGVGLNPPTPVVAHQTTLTAEEIRAFPEHINDAVYSALSVSKDSMRLPFDFPLEQVRRYLGTKNLTRLELMSQLPFAATNLPDPAWPTWMAGEFFGLNGTEIGVITTADPADQLTIWGLTGSSLGSFPVSQFLAKAPSVDKAREPLAYADLVTLLQGAFVQGSSTQTPSAPTICLQGAVTIDLCKTGDRVIQGLDAATLDRIHRLLRLARHVSKAAKDFPSASTGAPGISSSPGSTSTSPSFAAAAAAASSWKIADLDILISALGGTLNDISLQSLFVIARLCGRLNLAADEAAALFADFTPGDQTGLPRADGSARLFSRLFLLRDSSAVSAPPSGSLTSQKASLCGSLGLAGSDFDVLLQYLTTLNASADEGDLSSLSNLYRYSRYARGLGLPMVDFCAFVSGIGDPLSVAVSTRASALLTFAEEAARLVQVGFVGSDLTNLTSSSAAPPLPDPGGLFAALADPAGSWTAAVAQWLGIDTRIASAFTALPQAATIGQTLPRPVSITGATVQNGALVLTTAGPHSFQNNDPVAVTGVVGIIAGANSTPNQPWTVTVVSANSFSISAPSGVPNGTYQAGGTAIDQAVTAPIKTVMLTCWRLSRVLQLLNVTPAEIGDVVDLFTNLPAVWSQFAAPDWTSLRSAVSFVGLARTTASIADFVNYLRLLQAASPDKGALETALVYALRTDAVKPDTQTIDSFWSVLFASSTGWVPDVNTLLDAGHYRALRSALTSSVVVGVGPATWAAWANVGTKSATTGLWPDSTTASDVRSAIRSTFPNPAWLAVSATVQNGLRGKRRDALADFILSTPAAASFATPAGAVVGTVSDLSDSLLIDVEMGQCQDTSRVVQASAAIQLYVQRCFLGTEGPALLGAPSDDNEYFDEWAWRQQYQLWVANRLIFLYPENWLNTLARSSATPLFADFQQTVLQNQITTDNVEQAMDTYLDGLEDLANLDYLSVGTNYEADSPAVLGVVARTKASPPAYYYRQLVQGQEWSPWEKLSLGGAAPGLTVCQTATRAWIVWPTYIDSADPAQTTENIKVPAAGDKPSPTVGAGVTGLRYSWVTRDVSGAWSEPRTTSRSILLQTVSKQNFVHTASASRQTDPQEFGATTYTPVPSAVASVPPTATPLEQCGTMVVIRDTVQTTMYSNITNVGAQYFANILGVPAAAELQHELDLATINAVGQPAQLEIWNDFKVEDNRMVFAASPTATPRPAVTVPLVADPPSSSIPTSDPTPVPLLTPPNSCAATITMFDVTSSSAGISHIQPTARAFVLGGESWSFLCLSRLAAQSLVANVGAITSTTAGFLQPAVGAAVAVAVYGVGSLAAGQSVQIADSSGAGGAYTITKIDVSSGTPIVTLQLVSGSAVGTQVATSAQVFPAPVAFNLIPAYHPFAREITALVRSQGLGALYTAANQLDPNGALRGTAATPYATTFNVSPTSTSVRFETPQEGIDFDPGFPYRSYNYEVFFHAPMLVATQLSAQGQYQDAQAWFHYVFNPFSTEAPTAGAPTASRYWITKPFRQNVDALEQDITKILINGATQPVQFFDSPPPITAGTIPYQSLYAPILSRPFDADGVAQGRITAYQKFVVMQYLNNLIAWGDSLYRTGVRENIADASQIYSLAQKILGPAPSQLTPLPASYTSGPETYQTIVAGDTLVVSVDARPALKVTFQATDTTQSAVIGRINAAAGFALACPASPTTITLTGIQAGNGGQIVVSGAGTAQVPGKLNFLVAATSRRALAFDDADWSGGGNVLVDLESTVAPNAAGSASVANMSSDGALVHLPLVSVPGIVPADTGSASQALYFCVPPNSTLLQYWATVEGRLNNIRHCKTIDGTVVATPLLAAPINPQALANAAALGVTVADAIAMASASPPPYRFHVTFGTAKEYCADVKSLGAQLLAAMEKRDADQLERLRSSHEGRILTCNRNVKNLQRSQELAEISTLQASRAVVVARQTYYAGRSYMNSLEAASEAARGSALALDLAGMTVDALASVLGVIPDFVIGIEGVGGSPTATTSIGGSLFSRIVGAEGQLLTRSAGLLDRAAGMASTQGGYARRMDDWQFQAGQAILELQQIDAQIAAANLRVAIIDAELQTQTVEEQDWSATDTLLRQKFTNTELYNWIVGRLTSLYQTAYGDATKMANLAAQCLKFELGARIPPIAPFDQSSWDGSHAGFLAGEALDGFLRGLGTIHINTPSYDRWIVQDVPLSLVDGQALYRLRVNGATGNFKLPAWWLEQRYRNLTNRRIRTISFSIPCVTGRFAAVNAVVTGPQKSISLSTGLNDFGWDMNSAGDRYVPFEGVDPADSQWSVAIPPSLDVDWKTISDVILHVQYSADEGGTSDEGVPASLNILVDIRAVDPAAWVALVSPAGGHACTIDVGPLLPSFASAYTVGLPTTVTLLDSNGAVAGAPTATPTISGSQVTITLSASGFSAWETLLYCVMVVPIQKAA